jgi:hypothetical protein
MNYSYSRTRSCSLAKECAQHREDEGCVGEYLFDGENVSAGKRMENGGIGYMLNCAMKDNIVSIEKWGICN